MNMRDQEHIDILERRVLQLNMDLQRGMDACKDLSNTIGKQSDKIRGLAHQLGQQATEIQNIRQLEGKIADQLATIRAAEAICECTPYGDGDGEEEFLDLPKQVQDYINGLQEKLGEIENILRTRIIEE